MPAGAVEPFVSIQAEDFDAADVAARLTAGRSNIGAVVTFTGLCRDEDGALAALELEHYPQMAEKQIRAIAGQAIARWPLDGLAVIHRHGKIAPGGNIVLVAAVSAHREAAFTVTSIRNRVEGMKKRALGHTIRTAQYRYTEWQDGELGIELYDYAADPQEYVNLARVPGHEGLVQELQTKLSAARDRLN